MSYEDDVAMAWSVLVRLQAAIEDEDHTALSEIFDDEAVLIGPSTHCKGRQEVDAYLATILAQPGSFHWEWRDVVVFHEAPGLIGFASFGEVVYVDAQEVQRAPFRLTVIAEEHPGGWLIRLFHGSMPSNF